LEVQFGIWLDDLFAKGYSPVAVYYAEPEKHFALLLGFKDGRAITVDPARGLESLSCEAVKRHCSGVKLYIGYASL
jgi:hypothetical protein